MPVTRRALVKLGLAFGVGLQLLPRSPVAHAVGEDPRRDRPHPGDRLVFSKGERKGVTIRPADVGADEAPLIAYPMDLETDVLRDGSRLNRVLLVRLDAEELDEKTRIAAAGGIVAYSAVCTHTGCDVSEWEPDAELFSCPCHNTRFDPKQGARVVSGPAPRRLATLPLRIEEGVLVAAGKFAGRVGFQQP